MSCTFERKKGKDATKYQTGVNMLENVSRYIANETRVMSRRVVQQYESLDKWISLPGSKVHVPMLQKKDNAEFWFLPFGQKFCYLFEKKPFFLCLQDIV